MQSTKLGLIFALLAVAIITPNLVFAETKDSAVDLEQVAADAISGVIIAGGSGAGMGFVLSFVRVMGKNLNAALTTGKPEPLVIYKLVLTMAAGTLVGVGLSAIGVPAAEAVAWNFVVTFVVTQLIFPLFGNRKWKIK